MPIRMADRLSTLSVSGILRMIAVARTLPDVVGLHVGEPDFPTPNHIINATVDFLRKGRIRYVPSQGLPDLREAIAKKLSTENDLKAEANDIIVTAGATEAIFLSVLATANPGDEVIVFEPGFGNFSSTSRVADAFPVRIPYTIRDGYARIDEEALKRAVSPRTKAMIINWPNNPTSSVLPKEELEKIAKVAAHNNITVIADEIYDRIVYDGFKPVSMATMPGMEDLTITINGLSKTYAMTGLRIGYLAAKNQPLLQKLMALQEQVMICVSPAVQAAGLTALTGPQEGVEKMRHEFEARRDFLLKRLGEIEGVAFERPRGAFYFFPDISRFGLSAADFCEKLMMDAHVLMVPGTTFGEAGAAHVRISFAASIETLSEGMNRLEKFLRGLRASKALKCSG